MVGSGLNETGESFGEVYKCEIEYPFSDKFLGIRGSEFLTFNEVLPERDRPYVNSMDVYVSLRGSLRRAYEHLNFIKKRDGFNVESIIDLTLEINMRKKAVKLLEGHLRLRSIISKQNIRNFASVDD